MAAVKVWVQTRGPLQPAVIIPKAVLATAGGLKLTLPFAPREAQHDGWADTFTTLDRPGRSPVVVRTGDGLPTLSFDVLLGRRDHQVSVEDYLTALGKIARSGDRVSLAGLSKLEAGPWRLTGCPVQVLMRAAKSNAVTRCMVSIQLTRAVDPVVKVGPITGGAKKKAPKPDPKHTTPTKTKYHTVKKGETLQGIAVRYYGDPDLWRLIAKASKIKDPRKLKVGQRLTIPPKP